MVVEESTKRVEFSRSYLPKEEFCASCGEIEGTDPSGFDKEFWGRAPGEALAQLLLELWGDAA
jgi:hypothetical protein